MTIMGVKTLDEFYTARKNLLFYGLMKISIQSTVHMSLFVMALKSWILLGILWFFLLTSSPVIMMLVINDYECLPD